MKKLIATLLALCVVGGALPTLQPRADKNIVTANAAGDVSYTEVTEGALTYRIYPAYPEYEIEAYAEIIKCNTDYTRDIIIPDTIEDVPVRKIGERAFFGCSCLHSLYIPANVQEIPICTFLNSSLPPEYILSFQTVTVDEKNEYYSSENGVLFNKDKTELLRYPLFYSDKDEYESLMEYDVPDTVEIIHIAAFYDTYVEKVKLPDKLRSISFNAFAESDIIEINIPDSVTGIGDSAFRKCRSLEKITIPDSVKSIGEYAFSSCDSLKEVKLPKDLVSIANGTFTKCTQLKQIEIPSTVKRIGGLAFSESGLETVTLPASVQRLGGDEYSFAFNKCPNLKSVTVYNPECYVDNHNINNAGILESGYRGVIFGQPDSATQKSAEDSGFTFIPMDLDSGKVRVTLVDYDTGELIPDSYIQEHNYTFGTDIDIKDDDVPGGLMCTGPFFTIPTNQYVFKDDLPDLYAIADRFTICTDDDIIVNHYTNETSEKDLPDSMDIVIRVKAVADSYLKPGRVEVKLVDYKTGNPLELNKNFNFRLPLEVRAVDEKTGALGDYVDIAGPEVTSNHFICDETINISSDCRLTSVNVKNESLPTGYKCPTCAGEVVKNANGSYTVTVKLDVTKATLRGDANLDNNVNIADAVFVMQVATNPDKYGPDSKNSSSITAQGYINADVDGAKGLTNKDALLIQQYKLGIIDEL